MGTPIQKMKVQFDTGSAIMYVMTEKCENCPKDMARFNTKESTTFKGTGERQSQPYGTGNIEGEIAQETVCFTKDGLSCIENVSLIAVDQATDVSKDRFSGIVGLSPFQADASNMPAFITQGEQVFSFFLSKQEGSSNGKIVLGGWDLDQYAK